MVNQRRTELRIAIYEQTLIRPDAKLRVGRTRLVKVVRSLWFSSSKQEVAKCPNSGLFDGFLQLGLEAIWPKDGR